MTEKRTSSARARSGFTLAELLIVTGIVAILVAVSIPIMSGQVQKVKEVRAKARRGFYAWRSGCIYMIWMNRTFIRKAGS